ncbi:MAG: hypothetical protein KKE76_10120 [Gammaproteobacteria bacterium]|nr:hypothetical protein [Gammaproteobacteria bacterium]
MSDLGRYDYIQARLQARHGQRPDAAFWQRLGALRDLSLFLQTARTSGLRPWLEGISPDIQPHRIEQLLRQRFRSEAQLVAGWQPRAWKAATDWIAFWVDLPALGALLRSERPPDWMKNDPDYHSLAELPREARAEALLQTPWAALAPRRGNTDDLRSVWFKEWKRRRPRDNTRNLAQVDRLAKALHTPRAGNEQPATSTAADVAAREQWRSMLNFRFRELTRAPVSAMVYLFMIHQDMERLRGDLLQRRLFTTATTETT